MDNIIQYNKWKMTSCVLRDEPLFFIICHTVWCTYTKFNLKSFKFKPDIQEKNILAVIGHKSDNMTVSLSLSILKFICTSLLPKSQERKMAHVVYLFIYIFYDCKQSVANWNQSSE